jgi:hypothetical protein
MPFEIRKATRELIWVKVALIAPSGGGKTYSSLRVATGMLEELKKLGQSQNGKILMANTESSRGLYYANEFTYDIVNMTAPHNPENYTDLIEYATQQKYPILIMDGTSPEWEGKGGCLELHQQAGGTYQAWAKVTPRHDKFIMSLADAPIHIVATMRGKDQYEMQKEDSGKINIKKFGVGAKQRENFEYEFTCTFLIDQKTNLATPQKDNTHLFENEGDQKLTEKHGTKLIQWANSGEGYTVPVREVKSASDSVKELKEKVVELCKELGGSKNEQLMIAIKEFEPSGNPNKIKDVETLTSLLEKLSTFNK